MNNLSFIENNEQFNKLNARDRCLILKTITELGMKNISGVCLSKEEMSKALEETGFPDLCMDMYGSFLLELEKNKKILP
ncbi:hypothetical protein [Cyanothece sp. BG0011]|uniref:hypothetical protein n=1 Tax=Cyanothece sp. BG0011 TaxID=2082950 RepID=UPI000D1D75D7|nr:hypothetical protein [Cyanothece sp. BG0011]